jgi:Skp family chaperone for outer membrane proteins
VEQAGTAVTAPVADDLLTTPPALAPSVPQTFLPVRKSHSAALDHLENQAGHRLEPEAVRLVYRPAVVALGQVSFVDRRREVDARHQVGLLQHTEEAAGPVRWQEAPALKLESGDLETRPAHGAAFAEVPSAWTKAAAFKALNKDFKDWLYHEKQLEIFHLPALKLFGEVDESPEEFLGRARLVARENRDAEVDKLSAKVQKVMDRLEKKLDREQRELDEDQAEYDARKREELLSAGETLVGMLGLFGRKKRTGLATASRKRRMTSRAKEDIRESQEEIQSLQQEIQELERSLQDETRDIADRWDAVLDEVETFAVKPRRTDVKVEVMALGWVPYWETTAHPEQAGTDAARLQAF